MSYTGDGTYLERLEKKLQEYFKDELSIYRSEPFFLEIMPPLIDKAKSLEKLLQISGLFSKRDGSMWRWAK